MQGSSCNNGRIPHTLKTKVVCHLEKTSWGWTARLVLEGLRERDLLFVMIGGFLNPKENKTIQAHFYNLEKEVYYYTKMK
jgi:hypothetical protein